MQQYRTVLERYENEPRINKIGGAYIFTNSEKLDIGCKRLWAYSYMLGADKEKTASALHYGIAWHLVCEHILNEIKEHDTMITIDRAIEICEIVAMRYFINEQMNIDEMDVFTFIDESMERMKRAFIGWLPHWEKNIHSEYEIIATELVIASPVFVGGKIGKEIYTGKIRAKIERNGNIYPLSMNEKGDNDHIEILSFPYWRAGKIDVLLRKRNTNSLFILDHKTSSAPNGYARKFEFEQQLSSYAALVQYEIECGELQHLKDHSVKGIMWDIAHSKIGDPPELLKSGKLSVAKTRCAPSWIFEQAIKNNNLDRNEYIEHIDYCKEYIDPSYFQILQRSIGYTDIERSFFEDFATAIEINTLRNNLYDCTDDSFQWIANRYPKCSEYLNCQFSNVCIPNTPLSIIEQEKAQKGTKIHWVYLTDNTDCDNLLIDNENNYLF